MTGQGVSSRSSHSAAAGRPTPSAKPWTQSRMSRWSCVRSRAKVGVCVLLGTVAALRESIDRYTAFCLEYPAFLDCALSLMRRPARELAQRVSEGTWFRLGRAMAECLGPLADLVRAAGVEEPEYIANRIYVQVLG